MELNGDKSLRNCFLTLRKRIKTKAGKDRGKSLKTSYQLNIIPGEFNTDVSEIVMEVDGGEEDEGHMEKECPGKEQI